MGHTAELASMHKCALKNQGLITPCILQTRTVPHALSSALKKYESNPVIQFRNVKVKDGKMLCQNIS